MTPAGHRALPLSIRASTLIVCGLIPLLALFPPETRGVSMVAAAALIVLLVAVRPTCLAGSAGLWLTGAGALGAVAGTTALAPGAAVEPTAVALLALALGLATSTLAGSIVIPLSRALAASAAIAGAHALYQWLWGLERMALVVAQQPTLPDREAIAIRIEQGRAFAAFPTPAALGGLLAFSLPVTVALALAGRGSRRHLWWGCTGLQIAGLLAASSATATAALVTALALSWMVRRGSWRPRVAALAGAVLLLLVVIVLRGGALTDLHGPDSPWRLRAGNMRIAAAMALDHPALGVGPGGYAELYAQYRRPGDNETRHAHDLPLELAAEWGLPLGATLSIAFFVIMLAPLIRLARGRPDPDARVRTALAIGVAAFALHNLADFTAFLPSLVWLAAAARGALGPRDGDRPLSWHPAFAGAALVICVTAGLIVAAGGLGRDARVDARAASWADRADEAERLATRATTLAPWDVDAAALAARIASGGEALRRADRAIRLSPVRASLRGVRARLRAVAGDAPGALADLDEAARRSPRTGDYAAAADRFRTTLAGSIAAAPGAAR